MKPDRPTFFASAAAFRRWLERHASSRSELRVGFWKVGSGRPSMSWSESVDEALCFGWIDGVRRRLDERSYEIRFTPRRPGSNWSAINIEKFRLLDAAGKMTDAGRAAFGRRPADRSGGYSYERRAEATLSATEDRAFRKDKVARAYFEACPPGYRRLMVYWIASAKRPETRASRLQKLLDACRVGKRLL